MDCIGTMKTRQMFCHGEQAFIALLVPLPYPSSIAIQSVNLEGSLQFHLARGLLILWAWDSYLKSWMSIKGPWIFRKRPLRLLTPYQEASRRWGSIQKGGDLHPLEHCGRQWPMASKGAEEFSIDRQGIGV
jgi:hypothetical protein